jgi:putative DNA methylase
VTQTVPVRETGTEAPVKVRKKLIEVALPLEKVNLASAREKSIRHGHPSTLHLWWARRPLAAARAVIFSQMVDDPSEYAGELLVDPAMHQKANRELATRRTAWLERRAHQAEAAAAGDVEDPDPGPEPTLEACAADLERERLFTLIEALVLWETTTNASLLEQARAELLKSWRRTCDDNRDHPYASELFDPNRLPAFHDPFAGGGALPLEAQRLGLEAHASDLNPVAVLINKAMIEIPPKFAGRAPVNPEVSRGRTLLEKEWPGAHGIAEDVRYYGQWMRDEAEKRIGHLYPKVEITAEIVRNRPDLKRYEGQSLTVIAWLWTRTVKSPNPAFASVDVPLASTFMLSTRAGNEAYVAPVITNGGYRFSVMVGKPTEAEDATNGTKLARGANFKCLMSGTPISGDYIKSEGKAGRIGARLMAIVAEGDRGRIYLEPTPEQEAATTIAKPVWRPELTISGSTQYVGVRPYGMERFDQLFTDRQLVVLATLSDLVLEASERVNRDAVAAGIPEDGRHLRDGGSGALAYSEAVAVSLAFIVDKGANMWSTLCFWMNDRGAMRETYARQVLPMVWDFAEANPFSSSGGNINLFLDKITMAIAATPASRSAWAEAGDAAVQSITAGKIVSTDPPYYDNVPYADVSDFFYVWLRRSLRSIFPDLFTTLAVPKKEELVAFAYRHQDKEAAKEFFLDGMTRAMHRLAELAHPAYPVTIYYAFRQSETSDDEGTSSTGWETFLQAVIRAGFALTGTWPMRTEQTAALKTTRNALASSIILVCRKRAADAATATRREFLRALKLELPEALANLQRGNIAPVDLAQAAIGPGMAVYTRYGSVLGAEGRPLSVREALALINQTLDEALAEQEGDFDADSRWALAWYEQFGFGTGKYGVAETLSKAKNTSVDGMVEAGIVASKEGNVRLLRPDELDPRWDPATDERRPAWQAVHQLVQAADRGEAALADLITQLGPEAEIARELAYRLFVLAERKKRAEEALWYNGLVQSWPEAVRLATEVGAGSPEQQQLFGAG